MRRNPARRAALLDAAIEVLAREGSRGLTFRAVDNEAQVPTGTATNYFRNRDDLLAQAGERVYERILPDDSAYRDALSGPRDHAKLAGLMRDLVVRLERFPSGYLALVELRLAAMRRPDLRAQLTERIGADIRANIAFHEQTGLPGDADTVVTLYLALNWLVLERLTLPGLLDDARTEAIIDAMVRRLA